MSANVGKIIKIPHDSNKFWVSMFYALPKELVSHAKRYLDFPRCPYDVLRTDKYDDFIDDAFVELVLDCTAWASWQMLQVPDKKGRHRPMPGSILHYSGDFHIWTLCYSVPVLLRRKLQAGTPFSFQSLARMPRGMQVPWLEYQQYGQLFGTLIPQIVKEQNWQPVIDEAWQNRVPEDFSTFHSRTKSDFLRQWTHSRTKVGASLSTDEMKEQEDDAPQKIEIPQAAFEGELLQRLRLNDFASTLQERDRQILQMKMNGQTAEQIAAVVGYSTHSAVVKRLQRIGEMYQEYTRKEYDSYRETF